MEGGQGPQKRQELWSCKEMKGPKELGGVGVCGRITGVRQPDCSEKLKDKLGRERKNKSPRSAGVEVRARWTQTAKCGGSEEKGLQESFGEKRPHRRLGTGTLWKNGCARALWNGRPPG